MADNSLLSAQLDGVLARLATTVGITGTAVPVLRTVAFGQWDGGVGVWGMYVSDVKMSLV